MHWRSGLARIKNIAHGGLSGLWIVDFYPFPDSVLLPDVVTVIQHVGGPVQCTHDLDLICRHAASELESGERVLRILKKSAVVDGEGMQDELDAPRGMCE